MSKRNPTRTSIISSGLFQEVLLASFVGTSVVRREIAKICAPVRTSKCEYSSMRTSTEMFLSLSNARLVIGLGQSMDPLEAGSVRPARWHKAVRCVKHVMQHVQIVPAPLLSLSAINRSRILIMLVEKFPRALTNWWHDSRRMPASPDPQDSTNQS